MAPVEQQISAEKAANLARAQAQMGFSKAAASIMQAAAPAVSDLYSGAANADAGYARGLGDTAQSAVDQQAASNNAFLKSMGTPTAGLETAAPIGDISYGLHGYIPATTLQREGAAFGSAAQLAPENVLNQGQQLAGSTLAYDKNLSDLQGELGKIAATEPATYQDILKGYQDQAYKQSELGLRAQSLASENAYRKAELGMAQQRLNFDVSKQQWTEYHAQQLYGLSYAKFQAAQAKAAKHGGLTPSERNTMMGKAQDFVKGLYQGIPSHVTYPNKSNGLTAPRIDGWKQQAVTYQRAIKLLIQRYPALGPHGAIALANTYYQPGEGGRPQNEPGMASGLFSSVVGGYAAGAFGAAGHGPQTPAERTIVGLAHQYMGTPYVWGGESPKGFDCSGLAQYIYGKAGVKIPRTTYQQWHAGHAVPIDQLQPGDLVFFRGSDPGPNGEPGHVGIYVGGGRMIDSPHTGASVEFDNIASFGGYEGARRYG